MITPSHYGIKATVAILLSIVELTLLTSSADLLDKKKEGSFRKVDGGILLEDYPLNGLVAYLAQKAGYQYFSNPALDDVKNYSVTGQLILGDPIEKIESLAFQFGCTAFYRENTICLLTLDDLANLPRREIIWKVRYIPDDQIEPTINALKETMTAHYSRIDYAAETQQLKIQGRDNEVGEVLERLDNLDSPAVDPIRHHIVPSSFNYTTFIVASPEKVWNALTEPEQVSKYYLCPLTNLVPRKGGPISYGNGLITGLVTTWNPRKEFAHSFKFKAHPDEPETTVAYHLTAIGGDVTQLSLVHSGFAEDSKSFADVTGGWPTILSQLKTLLETGKTIPWPKPETGEEETE